MGELAVILVWPALAGYAEAALAYLGDGLRPGRLSRFAIWGVRVGWLAQTALLVVQATRAEGFPWGTWAGSLNLFVWLVVGVYLIWGCRAPFRLLGLVVMPVAAALFGVAWAWGGARAEGRSELGDVFLATPLVRTRAIAEEPFEYHARIDLGGQRVGRGRPGDRIGVRAAVAPVAVPEVSGVFDAKLQ